MKKVLMLTAIMTAFAGLLMAGEATFKLTGVHCPVGSQKVEQALLAVPGVSTAKADVQSATVKVTFDEAKTNQAALLEAVNKTGYKAEAGDDAGSSAAVAKAVEEARKAAEEGQVRRCPMHASKPVEKVEAKEVSGEPESCPVIGIKPIDEFHQVLHSMHLALRKGNVAVLKEQMPALRAKCDLLSVYCRQALLQTKDPTAREEAESQAKMAEALLGSMDALDKVLKADPIEGAFNQVHEDFYRILRRTEQSKDAVKAQTQNLPAELKAPVCR